MFSSIKEELKYYSDNYQTKGDYMSIIPHNISIAEKTNKPKIAFAWESFLTAYLEKE